MHKEGKVQSFGFISSRNANREHIISVQKNNISIYETEIKRLYLEITSRQFLVQIKHQYRMINILNPTH